MITSATAFATELQSRLEANKASLGIQDLYYGDQQNIPNSPTVCVETGDKTNELQGAPRRSLVTMTVYLLAYITRVENSRVVRLEDDQFAENLESFIHAQVNFDEEVIDCMVTAVEFGYRERRNTLFRAARLTVVARQYNQLPSSI